MRVTTLLAAALVLAPACTETGDSPFTAFDGSAADDVPADVAPEDVDDDAEPSVPLFTTDIAPLLAFHGCSNSFCHGNAMASGLDATTRAGLLAGGNNGPAVVPCEPNEGTLLDKVAGTPSFGLPMPIGGATLSFQELGVLRRWIEAGAPDDAPLPDACP